MLHAIFLYFSRPAPRMRNWPIGRSLALLALMSIALSTSSCSKLKERFGSQDDEVESGSKKEVAHADNSGKDERPVSGESPDEPRNISQDIRDQAKVRRNEILAEVAPFDRTRALFSLVRSEYEVNLEKFFPNKNYDPDKFKSYEQVLKTIDREAKLLADLEYPASRLTEMEERAKKIHPLYKVGDVVETRSTIRNVLIRGRLDAIYPDLIIIEGRRIRVEDLNSPAIVHFQPQAIKARREIFIDTTFTSPHEQLYQAKRRELGPGILREHGYVQHDGQWVCVKHLIHHFIEPKIDALEKDYHTLKRRAAQAQVEREFREQGLVP